MKICVTGGAGFIGSWVAEAYVAAGHDVVVVDNFVTGKEENLPAGIRLERLDVTDAALDALFDRERFDIVNHHAAHMELRVSVTDPLRDAATNILGSLRVLEACRRTGVGHVVCASSGGAVYGPVDHPPADESMPARPVSPYGVAKRSVELYAEYYAAVHGLSVTNLRYTNVYGERQNPFGEAGVIAIFLQKFLDGQRPVINGSGHHTRDYIHVADVASANVAVVEHRLTGTYNCSTNIETSVNDIVGYIQAALGTTSMVDHGPAKAGDVERNVCTSERLKAATSWEPRIDIASGILRTTAWFTERHRRQG